MFAKLRDPGPNASRHHLEAWVRSAAALGSDKTFRVLDAGAGLAPYRQMFDHVTYEASDFAQVDKAYGRLEYVCDITDMPMPDGTYDLVICNQVLSICPSRTLRCGSWRG